MTLNIDDEVVCLNGSIDKGRGKGEVGTIVGFSRLSSYHPREAMVKIDNTFSGWFWESDLLKK